MKRLFWLLILIGWFLPFVSLARIGVGVGTGRVTIEEPLKAGGIYNIPSVVVFNTGDEQSDYTMGLLYDGDWKGLKPEKSWFSYEPEKMPLDPGKGGEMKIKLTLPLKVEPGEYFAFLTAHPAAKTQNGGTQLGVAAAAKLSFSVEPANWFQGMLFRIINLIRIYKTWIYIFLGLLVAVMIFLVLRKFVHIEVGMKKK